MLKTDFNDDATAWCHVKKGGAWSFALGCLEEALYMRKLNEAAWNALISACEKAGLRNLRSGALVEDFGVGAIWLVGERRMKTS